MGKPNGVDMVDDHTVVGRTVVILDAVVEGIEPIPLAALTRRTGIPKQTVRRIANDLVERGMLERTPEGYSPGQRLIHHGLVSAHRHGVAVAVQPYLQDLHLRTRGQAAWLAIRREGELILAGAAFGRPYLAPMAKSWFPTMSKLGPSMVLLAAGMIELAHQPEVADRVLRGGWGPLTRNSITDARRMRRILDEVHDTGVAHEVEQVEVGLTCTAAALCDSRGELVGALGMTGRCEGMQGPGLRNTLQRHAESLLYELHSLFTPRAPYVWNAPIFNQRKDIGYTWPGVAAPTLPPGH